MDSLLDFREVRASLIQSQVASAIRETESAPKNLLLCSIDSRPQPYMVQIWRGTLQQMLLRNNSEKIFSRDSMMGERVLVAIPAQPAVVFEARAITNKDMKKLLTD
jgi:hypothetical protein